MNQSKVLEILEKVSNGSQKPEEALRDLKIQPYSDLDFACVDSHRELRQGFPEVIFAEGKSVEQIKDIALSLLTSTDRVLATRVNQEQASQLVNGELICKYYEDARVCVFGDLDNNHSPFSDFSVSVISAGTSDLPVAEEAACVLTLSGAQVAKKYDIGVAGIQRLLANLDEICKSDALIVVAGMDGALASVIGGIVSCPVIAVPTSVGYGSNFDGLAPLLSMLNSCAAGITVVNIDNGFGAAMAVLRYAFQKRS